MSIKTYILFFWVVIAAVPPASPQSSVTLVESGYSNPARQIRVAPGQVVTFFLTGVQLTVPQGTEWAAGVPLPTSLAGLSASVEQAWRSYSKQLPLLSVAQSSTCASQSQPSPSCRITSLTVQMPSDLAVPNPLAGFAAPQVTQVTISEAGTQSQAFLVGAVSENSHIVTSCDSTASSPSLDCSPIVTHANGTPVSTTAPADVGETVVMYAFGLGATSPVVPEGTATPASAPLTTAQFGISFDYVNPLGLLPSGPGFAAAPPSLVFAGLTPGQVGLYQINFTISAPAFAAPSCPAELNADNLTVGLIRAGASSPSSVASICVDTDNTSGASATRP